MRRGVKVGMEAGAAVVPVADGRVGKGEAAVPGGGTTAGVQAVRINNAATSRIRFILLGF
jgi:hypothetical protein